MRIDVVAGDGERAKGILEALEGVTAVQLAGDALLVEYAGGEAEVARISAALVKADVKVEHLAEDKASLEELFMRLTKGELH